MSDVNDFYMKRCDALLHTLEEIKREADLLQKHGDSTGGACAGEKLYERAKNAIDTHDRLMANLR